HAGELEVAIGPVGAALEGGPEHALQRAAAQAEALEQEAVGTLGLHRVSTLAEGAARANVMSPSGMDTRRAPGHTPAHSMASPPSRGVIASLLHVLDRPGPLVILPHDNPDPDSMASAAALKFIAGSLLEKPAHIVLGGIVGRAENRAMRTYLNIDLVPVS